jgi:hypothetical protein
MAQNAHSQAPHHIPGFIPGADGSDPLFTFVVVFVVILVLLVGVVYFTMHALPEKMAHRANSTQLQLIGVLSLLALFTHNNIFWVLALLLAAIRLPDIVTPLSSIAQSLTDLKLQQRSPIVPPATAPATPVVQKQTSPAPPAPARPETAAPAEPSTAIVPPRHTPDAQEG